MSAHPGSLTLRRLQAGESLADAQAHVAQCETCRATISTFAAEQRAFEHEISFDRFAAGVERAARQGSKPRRSQWKQTALALAAALVAIVAVQGVLSRVEPGVPLNRTKGAASVQLVVAGAGPQREASSRPEVPEALAPTDRVRIGVTADTFTSAIVVSIDEAGVVTPIYGEKLTAGRETHWLPESLEFTGKGLERVVVVLSATPLTYEQVARPLKLAYDDARGDLTRLGTLPLPGEQFHRTFLKP